MNLDNIMFIIIFLLLIVILGFLYYMSNNIKKNQNKINILESDVNALRERLGVQNEKMNSIDNYLNKDMLEKKSTKPNDPVDFSNFLERISSMNGNMMKDENEYSEEDSSRDGSSEDESSSNGEEESSVDEEDDSTHYETEDSSSNQEESSEDGSEDVSIDDNVKSESSKELESESESESEPEPVKVFVEEKKVEEVVVPKKEEPIFEEKPFIGIDDLMDDKTLKKMPTASIKKLDLGTVMLGGDGKTKYIVALNKSGKKYWKRN
jgi:hypothetical protein